MKKILLIEDDPDTSELMGFLLQRLGFEVSFSYDVLPVPEIQELKPNLIIMDHRLNTGFGGKLCQTLKNTSSTQFIPIMMLSASHDIQEIADSCGANAYLSKPFDISRFENIVYQLTEP
ncbi:MAG TPA: response regulator [Mucilaginibacter sp.]|jgi:DNA-binding response OmpR family regulator|nr:response regulator [Mucilaginibacter sp.]HWD88073.1 response regulator [Mucilaginibacter sp.]